MGHFDVVDGRLNVKLYIIALAAGLIGAVGDAFLNHWVKRQNAGMVTFLMGLGAWNIALLLFSRLLTESSLARAVVLFLVANSLAVALLSLLYFREDVSPRQWLGMGIALTGIILMETGK